MNIGIMGVGGVGGYFGAKMGKPALAQGSRIFFLARGRHLEAIRSSGLTVRTASEGTWNCRPTLATGDIEELPVLDVCLLCVKSYDLPEVIQRLKDRVSAGTEIVPLLNGVDIYERIREDLRLGCVFPACVFIGTHLEAPGLVVQQGGACNILFGRDPKNQAAFPALTKSLFEQSLVKHEFHENILPTIWSKYIFIAAFGLVTACFDKTLGQVMESAALGDQVRSVMREIASLANRRGIALPDTIIEISYQKGREFPFETKTSFQRDFESPDKPDERDLFAATIMRMGEQLSVPTPATKKLWEMLERRKPGAVSRG